MSNINNLLTNWGKSQRQAPHNNEVLKNAILQQAPELSGSTAQRRLPWLSFALAGFAVLVLIFQPVFEEPEATMLAVRTQKSANESVAKPQYDRSLSYPAYTNEIPITDDREFLKMNYRTDIRTRNVSEMSRRIQTIIHGHDGRIDSLQVSPKNAQIQFAIPANKFEVFRSEIESLTKGKLISVNINAQNLLTQKQQIESQPQTYERDAIDRTFMGNIATVNGTINLRFVSIWEVLELYVGPYWLPILLGIAAVLTYLNRARTSRIVLPV
ncbi:MAG: DUF4349 domain-containing protein [Patescibacteria group bacterium]